MVVAGAAIVVAVVVVVVVELALAAVDGGRTPSDDEDHDDDQHGHDGAFGGDQAPDTTGDHTDSTWSVGASPVGEATNRYGCLVSAGEQPKRTR